MCLAMPMQITRIDGFEATCTARGVKRTASLFLLQDELPKVGDWVLIHVGYAIQQISAAEAQESWELFAELLIGEVSADSVQS